MIALISAVFIASLLGSMHCAGMCGAFLAFAVGTGGAGPADAPTIRTRAALHGGYHLGRLVTYTALGVAAGSIGAAFDLGGSMLGLQRTAAMLAGVLMVGFGVVVLLRTQGVALPRAPVPGVLRRMLAAGHRAAFALTPIGRALAVGLLTTLLPCGWLYAFVITSAGTAHPLTGGITMAVFWAGTLPVMLSLGAGLQAVAGPLGRRLPLLTSLALVGVGVFTVAARAALPPIETSSLLPARASAADSVRALNSADMPCCADTP